MLVEGLIDKDYLDIVIQWGHEPNWVCTTVEEAHKKGYDLDSRDGKIGHNLVLVSIWIDMRMEEFFKPEDMIKDKPDLLSFMAVSPNKTIRKFAEQKLKEM